MSALEYRTATVQAGDGVSLFCRIWNPGTCGGDIYLVHGLGEHSGRYVHVGQSFAEAGFRSIAFDLRGHGRSGGKPVFVNRYEELGIDVQSVIGHFGGVAPFLFGHSMGGQLVLWFAERYKMNLAGVIASAPWLSLAQPPPLWQIFVAGLLNRCLPGCRFPTNVDRNNLSHDLAHLDTLEDLDLLHNSITVRFYFEALGAAEELARNPVIDIPVLITQGGDDRVTSRSAVETFFEKLHAPSKTLKVYPGLFHELHNETARREVIDFMLAWMNSITGSPLFLQSANQRLRP